MPIYSYRCPHGHVHDALEKLGTKQRECPECQSTAELVILSAPKIGWLKMGYQKNASPEFQERFDKMHRQQKAKEEKSLKEHGDYGASHGYSRPAE